MSKFTFGNIVVVEEGLVGVVVKSWADDTREVYVREYNIVKFYKSIDLEPYPYGKSLQELED